MPKQVRSKLSRVAREFAAPYSATVQSLSKLRVNENQLEAYTEHNHPTSIPHCGDKPKIVQNTPVQKTDKTPNTSKVLNKINTSEHNQPQILSRGQRKRLEKKEKLQRKFDFLNYAKQVQEEQKNYKVYGAFANFSRMASELDNVANDNPILNTPVKNSKAVPQSKKKNLPLQSKMEIERFQEILNYAPFQKNPIEAIKEHLKNAIILQKQQSQK